MDEQSKHLSSEVRIVMIMELDSIVHIEGRGCCLVGGIRREDYDSRVFNALKGDRITVKSKDGKTIILDVKDLSLSRSLTGDFIIGINVMQDIKYADVKKRSPVNRYIR